MNYVRQSIRLGKTALTQANALIYLPGIHILQKLKLDLNAYPYREAVTGSTRRLGHAGEIQEMSKQLLMFTGIFLYRIFNAVWWYRGFYGFTMGSVPVIVLHFENYQLNS